MYVRLFISIYCLWQSSEASDVWKLDQPKFIRNTLGTLSTVWFLKINYISVFSWLIFYCGAPKKKLWLKGSQITHFSTDRGNNTIIFLWSWKARSAFGFRSVFNACKIQPKSEANLLLVSIAWHVIGYCPPNKNSPSLYSPTVNWTPSIANFF